MSSLPDLLAKLRIDPGTYSFGLFSFHAIPYVARRNYPPGDGFMILPDFLVEAFPQTTFEYWEARMFANILTITFTRDDLSIEPQNFQLSEYEIQDVYMILRIYYNLGFVVANQTIEYPHLGIATNVVSLSNEASITHHESFAQIGTLRPVNKIKIQKEDARATIYPEDNYTLLPHLRIPGH